MGRCARCCLVAVIIGDVNAAVLPSFTVQAGDAFYTVGSSDGFSYLVHIPFAFELAFAEPFGFLGVVIGIYGVVVLIIGGAVRQGLCQFSINLIKKDAPAEFNVLFSKFSNLGKCLLLNLAMWLLIFAWSLLLIVPGIIAAYRYAMAPYIMAQNPDIGVMDAIGQSKELMRGHKGRLFWLSLTFIVGAPVGFDLWDRLSLAEPLHGGGAGGFLSGANRSASKHVRKQLRFHLAQRIKAGQAFALEVLGTSFRAFGEVAICRFVNCIENEYRTVV